jgi:hypothetical protein
MPDKIISGTIQSQAATLDAKKKRSHRGSRLSQMLSSSTVMSEEESNIRSMLKHHAFAFFLLGGEDVEQWGEDKETELVESRLQQWRDSDWTAWLHRKKSVKGSSKQEEWVGSSFDIGDLMGSNYLFYYFLPHHMYFKA